MLLTIDCSGRVLDLFTLTAPEWGVTEAARELGLSKSKAHALLTSLAEVGLLRRTDRGRYRLGWRLAGLNGTLAATTDFCGHARPVLEALSERFQETAQLAVREQARVVYVDRTVGPHRSRQPAPPMPWSLPAHCTASGKVLLAGMPDRDLAALREQHLLSCRTPATIASWPEMQRELDRVRERGVAIDRQEAEAGVCCAAAPIFDGDGATVAAISIRAPAARFEAREQSYVLAARRAGEYVTRQLEGLVALPLAVGGQTGV